MTIRKQGKNLVLLLMTAIFFCMLGISISKWKDEKVGETQATKSAHEMFYPSVTMTPLFELNFSESRLAHFKTRKNLTEYYMNTSHITHGPLHIGRKLSWPKFLNLKCKRYQKMIEIAL